MEIRSLKLGKKNSVPLGDASKCLFAMTVEAKRSRRPNTKTLIIEKCFLEAIFLMLLIFVHLKSYYMSSIYSQLCKRGLGKVILNQLLTQYLYKNNIWVHLYLCNLPKYLITSCHVTNLFFFPFLLYTFLIVFFLCDQRGCIWIGLPSITIHTVRYL